jgi:hypothetical protein
MPCSSNYMWLLHPLRMLSSPPLSTPLAATVSGEASYHQLNHVLPLLLLLLLLLLLYPAAVLPAGGGQPGHRQVCGRVDHGGQR